MESGTEVLRAVAAICTAFQTAADTLEVVRDRKEKKKRKKDKEAEELFELKIIHKSLVEVRISRGDINPIMLIYRLSGPDKV